MSSAIVLTTPITGSAQYRETLDQVSEDRYSLAVKGGHAAVMAYAAELAGGFAYLDSIERKAEGQKARHGAYIYRLYASQATRGKIEIEGRGRVAVGTLVQEALARWEGGIDAETGEKIMVPLAPSSTTRYKYIAVCIEAGFSPDDSVWSNLVNYYVSSPAMTPTLKRLDPKPTRAEIERIIAKIENPPKVGPVIVPDPETDIEGESVETETETENLQGPEDSETETGETETETVSVEAIEETVVETETGHRTVLTIPAHEIDLPRGLAGKVQYAEAAIAGIAAERTSLSPELLRRLTVLAEEIAKIVS